MGKSEPRRQTGSDRIIPNGDGLIVDARREMPDWRVSRYRPTVVAVGGKSYWVADIRRPGRRHFCYYLKPWTNPPGVIPSKFLDYDEDYVVERDQRSVSAKWVYLVSVCCHYASPLLGFLPGKLKVRLNEEFGSDPVAATRYSLIIQLPALAIGIVYVFFLSGPIVFGELVIFAVFFLLLIDTIVRFSRVMEGGQYQYGFGEWLWVLLSPRDRQARRACHLATQSKVVAAAAAQAKSDNQLLNEESEKEEILPTIFIRQVGSDEVYAQGNHLVVIAAAPMDEWRVAAHLQTMIIFGDNRYCVVQASVVGDKPRYDPMRPASEAGAIDALIGVNGTPMRYVLAPWDEQDRDLPQAELVYDEEYVRGRDRVIRRARNSLRFSLLIHLFSPLLGLLYRGPKQKLDDRFGLDPRDTTRASLLLEAGLIGICGLRILTDTVGRSTPDITKSTLSWGALLLLVPDAMIRFVSYQGGTSHYGIYEWFFRLFSGSGKK